MINHFPDLLRQQAPDHAPAAAALAEARQQAAALLAELRSVEAGSPDRVAPALSLRITSADASGDPLTVLLSVAPKLRSAIASARVFAAELAVVRAELADALAASPEASQARVALADALALLAPLSDRLAAVRAELARLERDGPTDAAGASAWAASTATLQGELLAVARLEADAVAPVAALTAALASAEQAVGRRLVADAVGAEQADTTAYQDAIDEATATYQARVAASARAVACAVAATRVG